MSMWPAEEQCSLRAGFPAFQPDFSTSAFFAFGFLGFFFCGVLLGGGFFNVGNDGTFLKGETFL